MIAAPDDAPGGLDRREVVRELLRDRRDLLVVAGLGSTAWDVTAAGDHPRNFPLWGAMGGAAMIGFGLALARPDDPVAVITGDGEQLMGLGALATIGVGGPANLSLIVIDNRRYGETGMQPTHTAYGVDLPAVALASRFRWAETLGDMTAVGALRAKIHGRVGPGFASIRVAAEELEKVLPPRDGVILKARFREALGLGAGSK